MQYENPTDELQKHQFTIFNMYINKNNKYFKMIQKRKI